MGCIRRNLIVFAVAVSSLAACTGEALGPEYREISEEESGLQFYAPGLEGGYRNIIYGQDAIFVKRLVAVYGPKQGEFPHGQIILTEMPPGRHFTRIDPPEDKIEEWGLFENRMILRGPKGTAVNAIGRIAYAAFQADGMACVIFRQPFGTVYANGRGTNLLDGFYCKGAAAMMNEGEAVSILKVIGHRKYGPIARPSGWPSASAVVESSETFARSAAAYARAGDFSRAIDDFTEAIRLDPRNATYYRGRGRAYRDKGSSDRAIQDYDEAIRLDPAYAEAYDDRGVAYALKGNHDRAIEDFSEAIRLDPAYAIAYNDHGVSYLRKGDYDRAIHELNEAIRLDPAYDKAYNNRGSAYRRKGNYERAIQDYDEAIRLDPAYARALNNRGVAYRRKGDYERAIQDYDEAIRLDPKYAIAYKNRGSAYRSTGDYDRAIRDFNEAIRLDPDYANAFNERGYAFFVKGKYDRAIQDHTAALRIKPEFVPALNYRGNANRRKGLYDRAIADYDQAIRLKPEGDYAYGSLAWLLATAPDGRYRNGTRAVRLAKRAVALNANESQNHVSLAAAYSEVGRFGDAVAEQERAMELARTEGRTAEIAEFQKHLDLYRRRRPYRE